MAERFSFVIKQGDNMATTMNIEKRSLVAKLIDSLMANTSSPTQLETIALVNSSFISYDLEYVLVSISRYSLLEKIQLKSSNILQRIQRILLNLFKNYLFMAIFL
jgi:hypothetical protein